MTIIHLSFDYPDRLNSFKPKAVKNLIETEENSKHVVISLNRTSNCFKKFKVRKDQGVFYMYIFGFPFGVLLNFWMYIAYRRIYEIIRKEDLSPSIIHAHKLTFEGVIAYFLARRLKIPFIVTVRGKTDVSLFKYKMFSRTFYNRILQESQRILLLSPWVRLKLQRYFGNSFENKLIVLPNIVNIDMERKQTVLLQNSFITAFHFNNYKGKNIKRVIKAFDKVCFRFPDCKLDIYGDGPNREIIKSIIKSSKHPDNFFLKGELKHDELIKVYANYLGLILPSYPETFGLVFLEALAAGIPVIYSKNSGIDGYFEEFDVGVRVFHKSLSEIENAIEKLLKDNQKYKSNISKMILSGYLNGFSANNVSKMYSEILSDALITYEY